MVAGVARQDMNAIFVPLASIAPSIFCDGLAGGLLYRWRPKLAQHPVAEFCITFGVSLPQNGLIFFFAPHSLAAMQRIEDIGMAPVLQGLGTALILAIVEQVRSRDEQTRAVASAEVRALQARMNPPFLFNALNALAALATVAPREVPRATGRLRQFLRASFDQQEKALVPLEEELAVVRAYLDIESLRFGDRLKVEQTIDPGLLKVLVPPFSFQPLVENAVQHGVHSSPRAGQLDVVVCATGLWLEMSVSDDGRGVASTEIEQRFFADRQPVSRARTAARATTRIVRELISAGGAQWDWGGHHGHYAHSTINGIPICGRVPETLTADTGEAAPN